MAIMLAKTYAAFKAAGVGDEQAAAAAEELADYENRLTSIDNSCRSSRPGRLRKPPHLDR